MQKSIQIRKWIRLKQFSPHKIVSTYFSISIVRSFARWLVLYFVFSLCRAYVLSPLFFYPIIHHHKSVDVLHVKHFASVNPNPLNRWNQTGKCDNFFRSTESHYDWWETINKAPIKSDTSTFSDTNTHTERKAPMWHCHCCRLCCCYTMMVAAELLLPRCLRYTVNGINPIYVHMLKYR